MKSSIRSRFLAAFAAAALLAPAVRADYGDLLARFVLADPDYRVTDPSILAGLPEGSIAVEIPKGMSLPVPIPSTLRNESGHP